MRRREVRFTLDDYSIRIDSYRDVDWDAARPLVEAMADGARRAGGSVVVTTFDERTEEL